MDIYARYKAIKQALNSVCSCYFYIGQYSSGRSNVHYTLPVIFIEMPRRMQIDYFPGKLQVAKGVQIRIHLLTSAPYKDQDNSIQDSAIANHQDKLNQIKTLLDAFEIKNVSGKLLASQFIQTALDPISYRESYAYSVITYVSEFYEKEG